jgi:hypothetical protein
MQCISLIYLFLNYIVIVIFNTYSFRKERKYVYDISVLYMLARVYPLAFVPAARFSGTWYWYERYYLYVSHPLMLVKTYNGRAMAQAVCRQPLTAEVRVRLQGQSMWDLWWTKWH